MPQLIDLGLAQKKTKGLVDLGPAPTPIAEALTAVEEPTRFPAVADPSAPPEGFVPEIAEKPKPKIGTGFLEQTGGDIDFNLFGDYNPKDLESPDGIGDIATIGQAAKQYIMHGKPYEGEITDRLKNMATRAISPLAWIIPGVSRKELIADLNKEAKSFSGFGSAVVPAMGEALGVAVEWGIIYPALFKVAEIPLKAISSMPKIQKGVQAIESMGGVKMFAKNFPRTYQAAQNGIRAFLKGDIAGQIKGVLEAVDEGQSVGGVFWHAQKEGLKLGSIATVFSFAGSADRAIAFKKMKIQYHKALNSEFKTKINRVDALLKNVQRQRPLGVAKRGKVESGFLGTKRGLIDAWRSKTVQLDKLLGTLEAEATGKAAGDIYQAGQKRRWSSAKEQLDDFVRHGERAIKVTGSTKQGKPFERIQKKPLLPETRIGEVAEQVKEVTKAITHPVKTVRGVVARGKPPTLPTKLVKPAPTVPIPEPTAVKTGGKIQKPPTTTPKTISGQIQAKQPVAEPVTEIAKKESLGKFAPHWLTEQMPKDIFDKWAKGELTDQEVVNIALADKKNPTSAEKQKAVDIDELESGARRATIETLNQGFNISTFSHTEALDFAEDAALAELEGAKATAVSSELESTLKRLPTQDEVRTEFDRREKLLAQAEPVTKLEIEKQKALETARRNAREYLAPTELKKPKIRVKEFDMLRGLVKQANNAGAKLQVRKNPKFGKPQVAGKINKDPYLIVGKSETDMPVRMAGTKDFLYDELLKHLTGKPKLVDLGKEKEFEIEPGKFYTQPKIDEAITKGEMGEIEIEPASDTESKAFNKHIDYFQTRQLPEASQIRKIQKQMQIVNGQRLAGTITAKEANKKIQQLRKALFETAEKECIALRMTKGGKVSVAVRKAGTYVPVEFAEYAKFKNIQPMLGGGQDITRAIQQIDGSLTVKQKIKETGQAGQLEQNVLWPTRDMSLQKLQWLKEKTAKLKSILRVRKRTATDKQVNLVLEKIASQDRNTPIKKTLSDKTLRSIASPAVIRQAIDLREFYDNLIDEQNIARKMRGQEEIRYRLNYSPHILRDATIWEQLAMKGKNAKDVFAKKADLPDYIRHNKPFNPSEMEREGGIPDEKRINSARALAEIYIVTAAKDIFNTSIIQNNKAFIQQLEAMGYEKSANYLADWTAEAYTGIKPRLDRVVGLPVKAQKTALWFNRLRNMAVFPLNFAWNIVVQPSSLALTVGRYGAKNTLQGFLQWLVPSVRRQASREYYSYIVKAAQGGKITKQDAQNLIGERVKLKPTLGETVENIGGFLTNQIEKLLTGTSIRAARIHGKKRGLTGEALRNYASDGGSKTQSMYNDEDKPALLRNLTVKTLAPYQTFAYEVMNTAREWAGKTGTPPDTKLYRLWTVLRFLAAASVFAMIGKKLANRDVWSWKRPPIPFAEFWLSPIIRIFSKEYVGGSASGLTSPVQTAQKVAKGIDDVLETGNWRKLRNELLKYGPGIFGIPGGVQISRTVDAIISYSQGGVKDRRGRMMFKMEDPQDLVQAIFSGVWSTKGGRGLIEKRQGKKKESTHKTRKKRLKREKRMLRK